MVERILAWLTRLFCHHDDLTVREKGRLWLKCQKCGRETAGWTLTPAKEKSV